jgi:hypothetical protein
MALGLVPDQLGSLFRVCPRIESSLHSVYELI